MKKAYVFTILLFIIIGFDCCEKKEDNKKVYDYIIDGYIKSKNNENPISEATVELRRIQSATDIAIYKTILSVKTDSLGYFYISHSTTATDLFIKIIPQDTFEVNGEIYPKYDSDTRISINKEVTHLEDIFLYSNGVFTTQFNASDPFIEGDTLYFTVHAGGIGASEGIYPPKIGLPDERSFLTYGYEYVYFWWKVKRYYENNFKEYHDSLLCIPFKENIYKIEL